MRPKPNPPPGEGGIAALAKHRGVARSAARRALDSKRISPPNPKTGWFTFSKAMREWDRNTQVQAKNALRAKAPLGSNGHQGNGADPLRKERVKASHQQVSDSVIYSHARAVNESNKAALSTMDVEQKSDSLVSAESVKRSVMETYRRVRERLLALPDRLAARMAAITESDEVHELLTSELESALLLAEPNGGRVQ